MGPYEIREPLSTRIRERALLVLVCSWRGHDRPQKMHSLGACERCGH